MARPHDDRQDVSIVVEMADFGPISRASFEMRPLTILVGPNSSGKTYAATLIHSLFTAYARNRQGWSVPELVEDHVRQPEFQGLMSEMGGILDKARGKEAVAIPGEFVNRVARAVLRPIFEDGFQHQLERNFNSKLKSLVRITARRSQIKVSSPMRVKLTLDRKIVAKYNSLPIPYTLKKTPKGIVVHPAKPHSIKDSAKQRLLDKTIQRTVESIITRLDMGNNYGLIALLTLILSILHNPKVDFPPRSHYFPAVRSGIMQAYGPFVASAIQNQHGPGTPSSPNTDLNGIMADFAGMVIRLSATKPGSLSKIGNSLEKGMFGGKITLVESPLGIPEIRHTFLGSDIPLDRASAGIAENAPLSLFLRYGAHRGEILIIEEPEAHLHPANQLVLARHIVWLIRHGVRVLLTTHSAFFLEQLGMFVKTSSLTAAQRRKLGYGKDDYIHDGEVAPYVFQKRARGKYTVKEIPHSPKDGISQEEFVNLSMDMYNQGLKLQRALEA